MITDLQNMYTPKTSDCPFQNLNGKGEEVKSEENAQRPTMFVDVEAKEEKPKLKEATKDPIETVFIESNDTDTDQNSRTDSEPPVANFISDVEIKEGMVRIQWFYNLLY